jgi:RNA polymerase sigma factor (TIGR02999 family)
VVSVALRPFDPTPIIAAVQCAYNEALRWVNWRRRRRGGAAMSDQQPGEFTLLLKRFWGGENDVQDQMIALIYADLQRLAHRHVAGSGWATTLDTTSMLHESYLRMVSPASRHVEGRAHFLNLASRVMHQIIIDHARKRLRDADRFDRNVQIEDVDTPQAEELAQARQLLQVEEALVDLERINPRQAKVVECRFFAGMSEEETAAALDLSLRTVQRSWNEARTWLETHIGQD